MQPSPVVSLDRAVAVAMAHGLQAGLTLIETLAQDGDLEGCHLLHAARADLVTNDSERRYLEKRRREVTS
jgi:RNA polymerase sigma-70 factor (ECF subfamily)